MTLFLFLLGIVLILGIAKYNESNKLFWALLVCYILGFAGVKLICDSTNEESKNTLTQVQPTQALIMTQGSLTYLLASDSLSTTVKATSKPVSQAIAPACEERAVTLSNVSGVTEGLYLHILPNPPNKVGIVDDS